jgi:hypothetical protein
MKQLMITILLVLVQIPVLAQNLETSEKYRGFYLAATSNEDLKSFLGTLQLIIEKTPNIIATIEPEAKCDVLYYQFGESESGFLAYGHLHCFAPKAKYPRFTLYDAMKEWVGQISTSTGVRLILTHN